MSTDYTKYLATEVLSEQRTLSYRNLARAQKVHVNSAKCMLYDFYESQTKRKPGSLYATYLVAGIKKQELPAPNGTKNGHHDDHEDEPMPSSPPPFTSSMMDPSQQETQATQQFIRRSITLVREDALQGRTIAATNTPELTFTDVKSQYETITSLHIYSLSPTKVSDLATLTDTGRSLYTDVFSKQDPLLYNKTYGVIDNPQVRRRKGKRPVIPTAPTSKFQPVKEAPKPSTSKPSLKKEETTSRPSSRDSTSTKPSKAPTLKRGTSGTASDIFKSFAKSQPPKPKAATQDTNMIEAPTLQDDDEGESEDEALFLDNDTRKPAKKRASDARKEREDKTAKLRKMMDSDDEEVAAVPKVEDEAAKASGPLATDKAPEGDDDEEGVAWSDSDKEGKTEKEATTEPTGPKRKRGKRKVMRKKTTKDEDGYLVTKEEASWESFSESDHDERVKKPVASSESNAFGKMQGTSQKSAASGKTSGGAGKKAKGDIMSFFGKK